MTETSHPPAEDDRKSMAEPRSPEQVPLVNAVDLFHGRREICIKHEGVCYRLRITRRNKLILQK